MFCAIELASTGTKGGNLKHEDGWHWQGDFLPYQYIYTDLSDDHRSLPCDDIQRQHKKSYNIEL